MQGDYVFDIIKYGISVAIGMIGASIGASIKLGAYQATVDNNFKQLFVQIKDLKNDNKEMKLSNEKFQDEVRQIVSEIQENYYKLREKHTVLEDRIKRFEIHN